MVRLIFLTSSCNLDNGHHIISSFLKAPTGTKKSNLGRSSCSGKNSHHHFQPGEAEISKMRFRTTNVFWSTPSNKKCGVKYSYKMTSPLNNPNGVLGTLAANKESRAISLYHNGDILRLNRRPRQNRQTIHFNAENDTVFMDCHSL
jgi:hypothetical protein